LRRLWKYVEKGEKKWTVSREQRFGGRDAFDIDDLDYH
jgi:hypothetical protein